MLALLTAALLAASPSAPATPPRARYAVVVGNDLGGPQRARLWFAERDADRVAHALVELGNFAPEHVTILKGAPAYVLREALSRVEREISHSADRSRALLVLYYSGHAGDAGLELGSSTLSFDELRVLVNRSSAAVKVAVVDACQSGALTQVKGTRALPGLDFPLPIPDDNVKGVAYVASTAVGESAQESAQLGGSFFSHHFEVGLRGAADGDGDGLVTLTEAFRYTAAKTIVGTAGTVSGSQHPTYELKMSGRGDVVLSDLRRSEARLVFPPDPAGLYLVRGPGVLAELAGGEKTTTLALPAGRYEVQRREGRARTAGDVTLGVGETRPIPRLAPLRLEVGAVKGGSKVEVFAGPAMVSGLLPGFGASFAVRAGVSGYVGPVRLRGRVDGFDHSAQDGALDYRLRGLGAALAGLYGVRLGRFVFEAGPELGGNFGMQSTPGQQQAAPIWSAGGILGASAWLGDDFKLGLEGGMAALFLPLDHAWTVRPGFSAALTLGYGF